MRLRLVVLTCALAAVAAAAPHAAAGRDRDVRLGDVRVTLPCGWHARVVGGGSKVLQIASFRFAVVGGIDRIKAMRGADVLLTLLPAGSGGRGGAPVVRRADLLPRTASTPRGHVLARRAFCLSGTCFVLTADFAGPPTGTQLRRVNGVLATLRVG